MNQTLMRFQWECRSWRAPRLVVIAAAALGAVGCAHHAPGSMQMLHPGTQVARCVLLPAPPVMAESLWVVVTDVVRPAAAPRAGTIAEHVVFPLLYSMETTKCDGASGALMHAMTASPSGGSIDHAQSSPNPAAIDSPSAITGGWRATTGPYAIGAATDTSLHLIPIVPRAAPRVHVSIIDARVGRDAIDAGADVVITSDAMTIAYAEAQASLSAVPLPWDRVYVLIEPGPPSRGEGDSAFAVRADLATNALRDEARPVTDSAWPMSTMCPTAAPPLRASGATPHPSTARIVYDRRDGVARALAERLVALADTRAHRLAALESTMSSAGSVRAAGLEPGAFLGALASGGEAAYVVALPLDPVDRCDALDFVRLGTPWLGTIDYPITDHLTPLIETRAHAIVRNKRVGLSIDGGGNVYLEFGPRPRS